MPDKKISYEIKEHLGVINKSGSGWNRELNLVSWNGKEAKYALRDWAPEHGKMGKEITLPRDELKTLKDILNNMEERVYRYNPTKVILLIGVNDLGSGKTVDSVYQNILKTIISVNRIKIFNNKI